MAKQYEELEARVKDLETKMVQLMADIKKSPKPRKVRQLTDEQRAAIRVRLLAGQEAARKKRESEVKVSKKVKSENLEKVKPNELEKLQVN